MNLFITTNKIIIVSSIFLILVTIVINATNKTYENFNSMDLEYGESILLSNAMNIAQGAIDEAVKNNWKIAVSIVDTHGTLIFYKKMDNTQLASSTISTLKAQTAVSFKRSTKVLEDGIRESKRYSMIGFPGIFVEGGEPIIINDKIVGGIGVSGSTSENDSKCVKAGLLTIQEK